MSRCIVFVIVLLTPIAAAAQSVAMLPSASEADAETVRALERRAASALVGAGWRVLTVEQTARELARRQLQCSDLDCAAAIAEALDVDGVLRIRTWTDPAGELHQIVMSVARRTGPLREGSAGVSDSREPTRAFDEAISTILARSDSSSAQFTVHGAPIGATVVIDGQPAGTLPWTGPLAPGEHEIVVSHIGYAAATHTISAVEGGQLEVALIPEPNEEGNPSQLDTTTRRERPWYSIAGPIALAAAGVGFLAIDVAALAEAGCEIEYEGRCVASRSIDEVPFALWGVGGLGLVAAGAVWFALGEAESSSDSDGPALRVSFGAQSLAIRGRF